MLTATVYDNDWEPHVYTEVKDTPVSELGHLVVMGNDDKAMAIFAPGAWAYVELVAAAP